MTYSEKLKDPRWQKKRLEIMQRDKFTCRACDEQKKTLNVHHLNYEKNKDPWDYDDLNLVTLCEDCHNVMHWIDKFIKESPYDFPSLSLNVRLLNEIENLEFERFCEENKDDLSRYNKI